MEATTFDTRKRDHASVRAPWRAILAAPVLAAMLTPAGVAEAGAGERAAQAAGQGGRLHARLQGIPTLALEDVDNPALARLVETHDLWRLGRYGRHEVYLSHSENEGMRTVYARPDGDLALSGVLYTEDGVQTPAHVRAGIAALTGETPITRRFKPAGQHRRNAASAPDAREKSSTTQVDVNDRGDTDTRMHDGQQQNATAPSAHEGLSDQERFSTVEADAAWIKVGAQDAPVLYMFDDLGCPFCKAAIKNLMPYIDAGRIQLRAIPLAILGEASRGRVAAILDADNPAELYRQTQAHDMAPLENVPQRVEAILANNRAVAGTIGLRGTPTFAFAPEAGGPFVMQGVPEDYERFVRLVENGLSGRERPNAEPRAPGEIR